MKAGEDESSSRPSSSPATSKLGNNAPFHRRNNSNDSTVNCGASVIDSATPDPHMPAVNTENDVLRTASRITMDKVTNQLTDPAVRVTNTEFKKDKIEQPTSSVSLWKFMKCV